MEKKQLISVVKPLIAAALLFGSSGGVAWGQIYKNQRNPDKAQASVDKKERAQLRAYGDKDGGLNGGSGSQCSGDHYINSKFTVENNYGPGESGILTPNGDNSGIWSSPATSQGFNLQNGRITLGGTQNHVGHGTSGANYDSNYAGHQQITVTASRSLTLTLCGTTSNGQYQDAHGNWQTAPAHSTSNTCWVTATIQTPSVPDGTGFRKGGALAATDYTHTTDITADASSKNPNAPWKIQQFYFMPNPWYGYTTSFTYPGGCTCSTGFYYKLPTGTSYTDSHGNCHASWGGLSGSSYHSASLPYNQVAWSTTSASVGYVDAKLTVTAGSDIRLEGKDNSPNFSIKASAANGGGKKYDLILPSGEYTLMNDEEVDFQHITVTNRDELGQYSVFGVQKQLRTDPISTNSGGGTILIGETTDATSQGLMKIKPSNGSAAGAAKGFSARGTGATGTVYTGTCIPTDGTANLGNYHTNTPHDVTVLNALNLPSALTSGGLQIFNIGKKLTIDKDLDGAPIAQNGGGHMLLLGKTELVMNKKHKFSTAATSGANTNLMGGNVTFTGTAGETFTGDGSGEYTVVAFKNATSIPDPSALAVNPTVTTCTPSTSWCNPAEKNSLVGAVASADQPLTPPNYQAFQAGFIYQGDGGCFAGFGGTTGNIQYDATTDSKITINTGKSQKAQWQAYNDILFNKSKSEWKNNGTQYMRWVAGHDIKLAANTQANWTVEGTSAKGIWRAGNTIELANPVTTTWKSTSGTNNQMGWQAVKDIKSLGGWTSTWESDAAGSDAWFEAGQDIDINEPVTVDWKTQKSGNLRWMAKRDIKVINPTTSFTWANGTGTGSILWEAGQDIEANNTTAAGTFKFDQTSTGSGSTRWHAKRNIKAKGNKEFTNGSTGTGVMLWRAGQDIETTTATAPNTVAFTKSSATAGLTAWQAGQDIKTDTRIEFKNTSTAASPNIEWMACRHITTHHISPTTDASLHYDVIFENASQGNMIWHANTGNITTNSKTTFKNTNTTGSDMGWYAGGDITTHYGKDAANKTMGDGIVFEQVGKGKTSWQAGNDIKTYNPVYFNWSAAADDATPITWLAKQNIIIGGDVVGTNDGYSLTVPEQAAAKFETAKNNDILLKSHMGMIQTNSKVDFLRNNLGAAVTKLWAGCNTFLQTNNIDIENEFNYKETNQADKAFVHLYAENDIKSNEDAASGCDTRPAPILFDISAATGSKTRTLWEAERNINTRGRVDFNYKGATVARALVWLARAGYIQTERPVTVAYQSNDTVSFRAEDWRHDPASDTKVITNANDLVTGGRRGNIHFFDSINIKRYNTGVGVTEIKAENHIWTAMVDYWENSGATANKMDIISHKGDIYLGYNNGVTDNYSHKFYVANQQTPGWNITQKAPSAGCNNPTAPSVSYDKNIFKYYVPATNTSGHLWIKAGWEEKTDRNSVPDKTSNSNIDTARASGGNIYFTHINVKQETGSKHPTVISIPHSGLWLCGRDSLLHNRRGDAMEYYENAGIISGVNRCLHPYPKKQNVLENISDRIGLIYRGAIGDLTVDAGNRGNIIFNKGAYLSFEDPSSTGDVIFRTRFGDIDMRTPFDVDTMHGSLLFLAQIENIADLEHSGFCGCTEERNNVYLQDFQFKAHGASGSVFVGADNNIKLNYGGLQNIGTRHDPFLSKDYTPCRDGGQAKIGWGYDGTTCGDNLHCDAIESENQARPFLMKFDKDANGTAITKGGFAAVASDYIDVYKRFAYYGGSGDGMGSVPGTGTLHGETVTGYGLFMKTQANKGNWNVNIFENTPTCPTPCDGTNCGHDYLHMVSRMTFHDDAYIEAQNQEVMLWSPVIETFGDMTLDSEKDKGSKTEITLKADSLIFHSDFIKKGKNIKLSTWSGLHNDLPIMKFGHMRKTPPFVEAKKDDCDAITECVPCYRYIRFSKDPLHMLDTITIKFGDGAYMERLNTVIFDHTVLTCLTDSFDHVKGGEVQHAQIRTDTFKIRNQVDLFADEKHERDAHLELISEEQMGSKEYAGIYTKHLHMEPIGACGTPYSELWTSDDLALDVITTSIFGGFGFIHSDVHVENGGHLNAGFTSLRLKGMCYEHMCGTQRMKDLRLDVGAQLHFSVGTSKGLNGEYSDAIEVDRLTTYGSVDVNIEIRPCEKIEKRCYPIIYYKSVTPNSLNQLKLNPRKVKIDGEEYPLHLNLGTDGVVYVCVGDAQPVDINRTVTLPSVSGVKTDPGAGIWDVKSRGNFKFKATYSGSKPLAVRTNRTVNGVPEMLTGTKNANGEYEYVVPNVQQDITLSIGPDYVSNQLLAGTAVWSHGEMIYIRVDRADIASIYSVAGQLVRKVDLPEGDTSIPMSRGAYVITLKDGSVHKVIVK